jgi:hypothetical protein
MKYNNEQKEFSQNNGHECFEEVAKEKTKD